MVLVLAVIVCEDDEFGVCNSESDDDGGDSDSATKDDDDDGGAWYSVRDRIIAVLVGEGDVFNESEDKDGYNADVCDGGGGW